jgi:acyl carrier protein
VLDLLTERIAVVLAVDGQVTGQTRFDEDLHADSLDLVEVVEGVEQALRERGYTVTVDDDALLGSQTVGEAAQHIAAGLTRA